MKGIKITHLSPIHTDERGEIWDLVNTQINHVGFLLTKKGSIRGNHYFRKSKRHAFVSNGKLELVAAPKDNPEKIEKFILAPGDLAEIEPGIIYTFVALEESVLIGMDTMSRANDAYEQDMVRVKIV